MEEISATENRLEEKSLKNRKNRRYFEGKTGGAVHASMRLVDEVEIGNLSPINRRFLANFFIKKSTNSGHQIVSCFLSNGADFVHIFKRIQRLYFLSNS